MNPAQLPGITPSSELRAALAGQTVLLAFSRGKDSIAAWLALRDAGVHVVPYHLYLIPGLAFVDESVAYYEEWFGTPIINLPHPSLYRWLRHMVFQPPERCATLEAAALTTPAYADINAMLRAHFQLPADTWVCDGVRAADSPDRRAAVVRHGPVSQRRRTLKAVWDWRKQHVLDAIRAADVRMPPDYEWFGRSFDGLDRRFLEPLSRHARADYARILQWFPLADLELYRPSPSGSPRPGAGRGGFRDRAARETARFRLATDSEYWIALCFRAPGTPPRFAAALGLQPDDGYLRGPELEEAVAARRGPAVPLRAKDPCGARPPLSPGPAAMASTGDLAADADAAFAALLAALTAPAARGAASVLDSPHYLIVCWATRAAKNTWLKTSGLDALGDKYLDGDAAAAILGLGLPSSWDTAVVGPLARRLRSLRTITPRRTMERTSIA